ncbi:hypothetical protein RJ640_014230 [Escallonia rubra]|uniref:Myb-like domain-containing protein n=1 Tax=Escallonia rubra TaxID=112253 RepID=A0AA88RQ26_9ASTE|nr:hypothetical protein RJ640_014230 [Escallonia rubra]
MITKSMKSTNPTTVSDEKKKTHKKFGVPHKPPVFDCECFDCYTSYWFRWDSSPNRELIHQAFEDNLSSGKQPSKKVRGKNSDKSGRSDSVRFADTISLDGKPGAAAVSQPEINVIEAAPAEEDVHETSKDVTEEVAPVKEEAAVAAGGGVAASDHKPSPFSSAPSSLTTGDIRVGVGPALPPPPSQNDQSDPADSSKKPSNRRSKARKAEEFGQHLAPVVVNELIKLEEKKGSELKPVILGEERELSEGDLNLLKKQLVKYPMGMPGWWEAITLAFSRWHMVSSVIREAKSTRERKGSDPDSFTQFLKHLKSVDKRIDGGNEGSDDSGAVENDGVN